jgi:glycosyltransferase involved in cell wall biosynthesis
LQVLPELHSGGVERGTVEISKALVKNGFVSIVASAGGHMVSQIENSGGIHIELPMASKNFFQIKKNAKELENIIDDYKVNIVHARSRAPAWSAYIACKKTHCHFVTTVHGTYSLGFPFKKKYNSVMTRGEEVIVVSEFIKDYVLKNYKVDESKIHTIHRGVDLNHFERSCVSENRILQKAKELNIEHDRSIILLPGRMTAWKGHEFLLEALAQIDKSKYRCMFTGSVEKHPEYKKRLTKKIQDLGLNENIRIIENVIDMPALYTLVDIVVSASTRPEAFGRIAVEAQAMGKMLIATNHGGACETVIDGETGWLVEPGNIEQLKEALEKVLNISDKKREEVSAKAKQNIKNNFSLEGMTTKTINIYKGILDKDCSTSTYKNNEYPEAVNVEN